jgi:transcriptional antiterminator RfaH
MRAEANLRQQGYQVWLPRLVRARRHARKVDTTLAPLFPGYLFIRLDEQMQAWRAINSTLGVRCIICHGETPTPVETGFVEALMRRADGGGVLALQTDDLRLGDQLHFLSGPFSDRIGTLLRLADKDRVALLLNFLGREVPVLVSRHQVAAFA